MLVGQHATEVHRIAAAIVGEADARDATQDSLLTAWRQLRRLRDADRFDSWLRRIVVNRCRNVLRDRARRPSDVPFELAGDRGHSPDFTKAVEVRAVLDPAFEALSHDHRVILALHYSAALPISEVARVLDMPEGTVKSRLSAGLARLRAALSDPG